MGQREKKQNASSDQTRHALARALKELMSRKPLNKITIRELTERGGIRRQNFYYHFEDILDLMRWMFQEEAISLLQKQEGELLWQEGLLGLFRYIEDNREVCLCALESVGRRHLKRFFEEDIHAVVERSVNLIGEEIGALTGGTSAENAALITQIYEVGTASIIESWLMGDIKRTPEELVGFMDQMLQDHIRGARLRCESESQN